MAKSRTQLQTDLSQSRYKFDPVQWTLSAELKAQLDASVRRGVSSREMLLSGWVLLLARWSGLEEVVVTIQSGIREGVELASQNCIADSQAVLRIRLGSDATVEQLLNQVRTALAEAAAHRGVSRDELFVGMRGAIWTVTSPMEWQKPARRIGDMGTESPRTPSELSLSLSEEGEGLACALEHPGEVLDRESVERIVSCWAKLLEEMLRSTDRLVNQLPMLTATERDWVLNGLNNTAAPRSFDHLVHELFERQVDRTPKATAVTYEGQSLTYAELNSRANRLARYLKDAGVGPDELVGIHLERSIEMVVGVIGVLKAAGAYVPLDPNYPSERLQYMLKDAAPRMVLTQRKLRDQLPVGQADVLALDTELEKIAGYDEGNLPAAELGLTAQNLAYVIYTSGSTGQPKGTAMPHRSVVNLIEWHRESFGRPSREVLQFAALSFDVAFQEIFSTLCTGGVLVLLDEWVRRDVRALADFVASHRIDRLFLPPLMLQGLAEYYQAAGPVPRSLCDVITAGEQLRISSEISNLFKRLEGCRLHNHYGPTETHVVTSLTLAGRPDEWPVLPSIGHPISNTQMYVLDAQRQPVPVGVVGELYIAGVGVARGYLRRPEMTADRFIANPFSSDSSARMYKTGDLGRWRSDGTIEYLGRNDDQVKIRGFRVELGEIEAQLARYVQVREAAVVARDDTPGGRRLVAYVTPRDSRGVSVGKLREYLQELLPDYMVPSAFVIVESFPLTPSGKLDRRALPAPDLGAYVSRDYETPQGEREHILAGIWKDLLGMGRVGRRDNFFELGGDSLLIVRMMERLRRVGRSVDVRAVYESPNLAALAEKLAGHAADEFTPPPNLIPSGCASITPELLSLLELDQNQIDHVVRSVPGGAVNIQDIYPLAPLQEGLLFHHLLSERGGDTYLLPMLMLVASRDRLEQLIESLQQVIDRHDALRTAVLWEELPQSVQVVYRNAKLQVEELALDADHDPIEQLKERMRPDRHRLDVRQAPMMRLQIAADTHGPQWYALLQLHHLACDHDSVETMIAELGACIDGRMRELPEPLPYRNHVAQALNLGRGRDVEVFFRSKLGDIDEPTAPFGLLDVLGDGSRTEEVGQQLENGLAERVRTQARAMKVSAATLFHVVWALVVSRASGRDDVVFGTVLLGRLQGDAGARRTLGMFMNTLPLCLRLRNVSAAELVEQTQRELVDLLNHEQASLGVAQQCSGVVGSAPLFSTLLNYRHSTLKLEAGQPMMASGVQLISSREWTNYPVTLSVDDQGDGFVLTAKTDRRIDPRRIIGYVLETMRSLVDALQRVPEIPVLTLPVMPERERYQVVTAFNETRAPYPREKLVHELFEEQVQRTPQALAAVYEGRAITFAELNSRANRWARHLRGKGIGPDQPVGICVERGLEMVVGLLAILKAGGAYVPLDPNYPPDRLGYMLDDAKPGVLLTQGSLRRKLPRTVAEVISLDDDWSRITEAIPDDQDFKVPGLHSHHLAYLIYTSGSTGQSKGVMVEHRNVVSLWQSLEPIYRQASDCERIAVNASFNFDASVKQFVQLLSGRTLVLIPEDVRWDSSALQNFMSANQVHGIDCTPSQLKSWISEGLLVRDGGPLRAVLIGGEAIDPDLWSQLAQCSTIDFYNVYGPTECTVDATFARLRNDRSAPHIGLPMENKRIYILDRHRQPVPIGVAGEMYIGGAGVARGYLNRPELTADRFVQDHFVADDQSRLYKTGDLGRWRMNGTIEYIGRNDQQVKIRGFRIELGEIEAQLAQYERVQYAAVVPYEAIPGDRRLVAYVTRRDRRSPSAAELRAHLSVTLPEYMVPSAFVVLDSFPLTPTGKLDRRALPAPELDAYVIKSYEAPLGEVEEVLASIWQSLLHIERVGRNDNFFELGGHSLLGMQVMVRIRSVLSTRISMSALFEFPTLRGLAAHVDELRSARLLENIEGAGSDIEELLDRVTSMSESRVMELVQELRTRGRL